MCAFLTKFANGFKILFISYKLFFKRPKYLLFPLLTVLFIVTFFSLVTLTVHLTVGVEAFLNFMNKFSKHSKAIPSFNDFSILMSLFVSISLVCTYVFTLISVAVSFFSMKMLENEPVTLSQSIRLGLKKSWKIFKWAIVAVVVNIIIRLLEKRKSWAAKILAYTGGVLWTYRSVNFIDFSSRHFIVISSGNDWLTGCFGSVIS